jgi:hypothetical protein
MKLEPKLDGWKMRNDFYFKNRKEKDRYKTTLSRLKSACEKLEKALMGGDIAYLLIIDYNLLIIPLNPIYYPICYLICYLI